MPRIRTARHAEITKILLSDWDPIGIADEPDAQDEYDDYVLVVDALIQNGMPPEVIADRLLQIAREEMALQPNQGRAIAAAKKLAALASI